MEKKLGRWRQKNERGQAFKNAEKNSKCTRRNEIFTEDNCIKTKGERRDIIHIIIYPKYINYSYKLIIQRPKLIHTMN